MEHAGLNGLCLGPGANMLYFCGFGTQAYERLTLLILPRNGSAVLVVPQLDLEKARLKASANDIRAFDDDQDDTLFLSRILGELGLMEATLGVDPDLPFRSYHKLSNAARAAKIQDASSLLYTLRIVKSEEELRELRRAAKIADAGIEKAKEILSPDLTESDVMDELSRHMRKQGAESVPFCSVLAGPQSALPHGRSGSAKLQKDQAVLIDIGCVVEGYNGDITRTFFIGNSSREAEKVYNAVLTGQESGIGAVRPDIRATEVDEAARSSITKSGFGDYFIHRTGHGLGLEVHEQPNIVGGNRQLLSRGMVFTVEPGVYLPGKFGIRIEDDVAVTDTGAEVLTKSPKQFEVL